MHFTIVSYTFPPSKEIGGRRWAKFSRYLSAAGHDVTVICSHQGGSSAWYDNTFPGVKVRVLPKRYPKWLSGYTRSFTEKFLYFLTTRLIGPFTKRNLFDKGFAWKKPMLRELEKVHYGKAIDVLVVTGAPFSLLYYGTAFKRRHPEIFYIIDFRDPWTWGSWYGIPNSSFFKKKYQEHSERISMELCDMVCYPTESMGQVLSDKYPAFSSKLYLLHHAFEPDKFPQIATDRKREGFVYGGTLYKGIESYLQRIADVVKSNPGSGFKWKIYTGTPHTRVDEIKLAEASIYKHPLIPEEKLFKELSVASAYLAVFPEWDKDLISTKFFEIIYAGTPILYIGAEGAVGRFVRENRLGVHIEPDNIERDLPRYLSGKIPFEPGYFDVHQFTFQVVTSNFLQVVENAKSAKR